MVDYGNEFEHRFEHYRMHRGLTNYAGSVRCMVATIELCNIAISEFLPVDYNYHDQYAHPVAFGAEKESEQLIFHIGRAGKVWEVYCRQSDLLNAGGCIPQRSVAVQVRLRIPVWLHPNKPDRSSK
jgi:hypothetical protein